MVLLISGIIEAQEAGRGQSSYALVAFMRALSRDAKGEI
jgi:hypothetical protein